MTVIKMLVSLGRHAGQLVIVAADAAGYRELRRTKLFKDNPETYTVPVLANGRIYCRSYAGEVVCLDLVSR